MEETTITKWRERPCAKPAWSGSRGGISAESTPGQGEREARGLTLSELGREYAQNAAALRERIRTVEAEVRGESSEERRLALGGRLRLLRGMYRDTRATANYLEHYYDHKTGGENHEQDIL